LLNTGNEMARVKQFTSNPSELDAWQQALKTSADEVTSTKVVEEDDEEVSKVVSGRKFFESPDNCTMERIVGVKRPEKGLTADALQDYNAELKYEAAVRIAATSRNESKRIALAEGCMSTMFT
jgi:hypothetical protein